MYIMGNSTSNKNIMKFNNINESIDYIATYYILTSDFKSLSQLMNKEYCDKLVILTSDIIKNKFKCEMRKIKSLFIVNNHRNRNFNFNVLFFLINKKNI